MSSTSSCGAVAPSTTPALEQRKTAWERCRVSVRRFAQEAELADIWAEFPEYAAIHSHVLQDVLARLDKAYQAFFRHVQAGEKSGYPRFQGRNCYHSFAYKEYGNGARLDNGHLVLSKIGRIAVHWSRPVKGTPKTVIISKEADGYYVCFSCADVPTQPDTFNGPGRPFGEPQQWLGRRTENSSGCSPCRVSE